MGIAIIIHVDDLLAQVAECHGGRLSLENKLDLIQSGVTMLGEQKPTRFLRSWSVLS